MNISLLILFVFFAIVFCFYMWEFIDSNWLSSHISTPVLYSKRKKRSKITKKVSKHHKRYKFAERIKEPIQSLLKEKSTTRENKKIPFGFENREPQSQDLKNNEQIEKKDKQNAMPKMNLEEAFFNNSKYYKSAIEKLIQDNPDVFKPHTTAVEGEIKLKKKGGEKNNIQPFPLNFSIEHNPWTRAILYSQQFEPKPFIHPHDKRNIKYEDEDGYDADRDAIVNVSFKTPDTDHQLKLMEPSTINLQHNEETPLMRGTQYDKQINLDKPHIKNIKYEDEDGYRYVGNNDAVDVSFKSLETVNLEEPNKPKLTEIEPSTIDLKHNEEVPPLKTIQYGTQCHSDKLYIHPYHKRNSEYEDKDVVDRDAVVDMSLKASDTVNLEDSNQPKLMENEPNTIDLKHDEENPLLKTTHHCKLLHCDKLGIHRKKERNIEYEDEDGNVINRDACCVAPDTVNLEKTHKPKRIEIEHSTIKLKLNEENSLAIRYAVQVDPNEPLIDPYDKKNIKYEAEDDHNANRDVIDDNFFISPSLLKMKSEYAENGNAVNSQPCYERGLLENKTTKNFEALKNSNVFSSNESQVFSVQLENKPLITEKSSSTCICEPLPSAKTQQPLSDSRVTLKESQNLRQLEHQIHRVTVVQNPESLLITCDVQPVNEPVKSDESSVHQPDIENKESISEVEQENRSSPPQENEKLTTEYKVSLILPKEQSDTQEVQDKSDSKTIQKPETEIPLSVLLKRVRLRNKAEHLAEFKSTSQTDLDLKSKSIGNCPEPTSQSICPPGKPPRNQPCPHTCPPSSPPPVSYPPQPAKPICSPPKKIPPKQPKPKPCCPKFDFTKHSPIIMINGMLPLLQQRLALGKTLAQNKFVNTQERYQRSIFGCSADIYRPYLLPVNITRFDSSIHEKNIENSVLARGCKANDLWSPNLWWPQLKKKANKPLACFKEGRLFHTSKDLPLCNLYLCSKRKNCFSIADVNASWSGKNIRNYLLNFNV